MSKRQDQQQSPKRWSMRTSVIAVRSLTLLLASVNHRSNASGDTGSSANAAGSKRRPRKMGEKDVCKCPPKIIEAAKRDTLFNRKEIEALYRIYKKLITFNKSSSKGSAKQNANATSVIGKASVVSEGIDRTVFSEVLHNTFDIVTENMLMDRIFCVWDTNNCGLITLENWFRGLNLFLKGNVDDQMGYCFSVYDLNVDGYITKDEMFQLLRNCLIKHPQEEDPEENVKDLVDIVMRKMDKDKDGKVSLQDFQKTVSGEPLLLEAFGRCLPSEKSKITFLTTLRS